MIVHLTDVFAPRAGGIEVHIESLAHAQYAAGGEVRAITTVRTGGGHGQRTCARRTVAVRTRRWDRAASGCGPAATLATPATPAGPRCPPQPGWMC